MPNPRSNGSYVQPFGSTRTTIHLGNQRMPGRLTIEEAIEEYCPFHNCHPSNMPTSLSVIPALITYYDITTNDVTVIEVR